MSQDEHKLREKASLEFIENVTRNAAKVQADLLRGILERSVHTEYLKRHGLDGRTDKESFLKIIPITTYEELEPDFQRIANGDTSPILSAYPVADFFTSSGTSAGQRKLIPMITTSSEEIQKRILFCSLLTPVVNQYLPGLDEGKGMYFYFVKPDDRTPGGLLVRPVLTSYFKDRNFRERPYDPFDVNSSPDEVLLCEDPQQSMYCQLLCGLLQRETVLRMGAIFPAGFLRVLRFFEQHWRELCQDIRSGTLNDLVVDTAARGAVLQLLRPNSSLADFIEAECGKDSWEGIIIRLWPNTKYVDVIVTGTMTLYIPTLNYYTGGGLPLVSTMYASCESFYGINLNPLCSTSDISYTLVPNLAYFEFLPVKPDHDYDEKDGSVELVDVKVGQEYEMVITNYAGLYRYRVGDIVRVTGFYNASPQLAFVRRKNVVLGVGAEKTSEKVLHKAVSKAATHIELLDYTSLVDTSTTPGHYVLFWELRKAHPVEECCLIVEESLGSVYKQGRVEKRIGPLEIRLVKPGTFDEMMDDAIGRGASINQYKTPRCVKFKPIVDLLNARVVKSYFSPRSPRWYPVSE